MSSRPSANGAMERVAAKLGRRARRRKGRSPHLGELPSLWFLSDPKRTPDPMATAARLPRGAALVYRAFGATDRLQTALCLRAMTRRRGVKFLIGADWRLAARVGADGVHLPQRTMRLAPRLRGLRPGWLITAAAHDGAAIRDGARWRLDAVMVSVVFASRSPSAGRPLGVIRFAALTREARVRVIALGGVNNLTARRLLATKAHGIAAVDGFKPF